MTEEELETMEARATDGEDHEWGWYVDDVPALIAEVKALRKALRFYTTCVDAYGDNGHLARAALAVRQG